jgi:hypothetical protein
MLLLLSIQAKALGVDYDLIHANFYKNAGTTHHATIHISIQQQHSLGIFQKKLGNWSAENFEAVIAVDKVFKTSLIFCQLFTTGFSFCFRIINNKFIRLKKINR